MRGPALNPSVAQKCTQHWQYEFPEVVTERFSCQEVYTYTHAENDIAVVTARFRWPEEHHQHRH